QALAIESLLSHYRRTSDHVLARMPGFRVIRELIDARVFPDSPQASQRLTDVVSFAEGRAALLHSRDKALMALFRAHSDDRWPEIDTTRILGLHLKSVLNP